MRAVLNVSFGPHLPCHLLFNFRSRSSPPFTPSQLSPVLSRVSVPSHRIPYSTRRRHLFLRVSCLFSSCAFSSCRQSDPYFPQFRAFDWFSGHSWARGLLFAFDGKDQVCCSFFRCNAKEGGKFQRTKHPTARLQFCGNRNGLRRLLNSGSQDYFFRHCFPRK